MKNQLGIRGQVENLLDLEADAIDYAAVPKRIKTLCGVVIHQYASETTGKMQRTILTPCCQEEILENADTQEIDGNLFTTCPDCGENVSYGLCKGLWSDLYAAVMANKCPDPYNCTDITIARLDFEWERDIHQPF